MNIKFAMESLDLHTDLEQILKGAGEILRSYWGKQLEHQQKRDGFLTEADLASEAYLIEKLTALAPADIWAEESGQSGSNNNGYRWVIDPLDGTTNFAYGIPYFCISVALTDHDRPIHAAIYNPLQNEFFYARRGFGAWRNRKKITVSSPNSISDAFIGIGFPYARDKRSSLLLSAKKIITTVQAVRSLGAIALDLAYLATGRFDGMFFSHLFWWDVAAGMLLIEEAGGAIADFNGNPITPTYQNCVAGGGLVFEHLLTILSNAQ
jgi:myo-inositol-1(or 4)-monophosphatase